MKSEILGIPNNDPSPGSVSTNRWDAQWSLDDWVYNVQVRASAGDTIKGDWTTVLSAPAHPQTAPGPRNVVVAATTTGFDISWDPPTGSYTDTISVYNILYWDKDGDCTYITGAGFTSSPAHTGGLLPGHHYLVAPVTWNAAGQGFPEIVNSVTVGAGMPQPPTDLSIIANDPTSIHMMWTGSQAAAGYRLWLRNVNIANSVFTAMNYTVDTTCNDKYYLFPGPWNYESCVSAFNGNNESPRGACVVAPSPSKTQGAAVTCSPPSLWCSNGATGGAGGIGGGGGAGGGGASSTTPGRVNPTGANQPWPVDTNGQCKGPDCKNGQCTSILCISFGCAGNDCVNGVCTGTDCTVLGCIGPGCKDGTCTGSGCITSGCVGP